MTAPRKPVETLDGRALARALSAGIHHLFRRREYINRINVFPVPDSDTGTNMAFTFKAVLDAIGPDRPLPLDRLVHRLTEAALDGARGNSGAIMAQFFQGCREALAQTDRADARQFAAACAQGAQQAWSAMSEPVPGTLPTVLESFASALTESANGGERDLRRLFDVGLEAARASLADTPNQLQVLKQAGVVDAGGQGFVDLLEGIEAYLETGRVDPLDTGFEERSPPVAPDFADIESLDLGEHRFCTECVIEGQGLDRARIMDALRTIDHSSMVVAGSERRVRVHLHVNSPADVFLACEKFGDIAQQKADDMQRQRGLLNQPGQVVVVTDSGADLPPGEVERLGIHVVPVRVSFGEREYLDGVSLRPDEFYRMLSESDAAPLTSQPPAGDFRRVYELLTGHGYDVLSVGLSEYFSGTIQAARSAAARVRQGTVHVVDTLNASCGQGLLAIVAAEAAAEGMTLEEVQARVEALVPKTVTLAIPDDLGPAVRGGRVPAWVGRLARALRVTPVLVAREGRMGLAGMRLGRGADPAALARRVLGRMDPGRVYRVLIAHCANAKGAREVRRLILAGHAMIHSCHLTDAGAALGAHMGKGGLIVGFLPEPGEAG